MKLLLVFLLGTVVLGLITDKMDRRTYALLSMGVLFTIALYFSFERFMT